MFHPSIPPAALLSQPPPRPTAAKEAGSEDLLRAALARFSYDPSVRRSAEHALRNLDLDLDAAAGGGGAESARPSTLPDMLEDMELNRQCAPRATRHAPPRGLSTGDHVGFHGGPLFAA